MAGWVYDPESGQTVYTDDRGNIATPPDEAFRASRDPELQPDAVSGAGERVAQPIDPYEGAPTDVKPEAAGPADISPTSSTGDIPAGGSYSRGSSYSWSGTPEAGQTKTRNRLEQNWAKAEREAAGQYDKLAGPTIDIARQRADNIVSARGAASAPSLSDAQQGQLDMQAQGAAREAKIAQRMAEAEAQAEATSQALIAKARAQYQSEVMAYKNLDINPGALWGAMGADGRGMALGAVFAHNFLAAKGINTTAMDSLNKAVDMSIDAQIANLNKQGKVVDHFGQLYNMVAAESASQAEVRQRLRGFYLVQAQKQIESTLLQYGDAPLALAKAAEARTMIADQLNRDLMGVTKAVTDRLMTVRGQYLDEYQSELAAQTQRESIASNERIAYANLAAKQAGAGQGNAPGIWVDPTTHKAVGFVRQDIGEAKKAEVLDKTAMYRTMVQELYELKDLIRAHGPVPTTEAGWAKLINGEDGNQILALSKDVMMKRVYGLSGKQINEQEVKTFELQFAPDELFRRGGVQKILSQTMKGVDNEFKNYTEQYIQPAQNAEQQAILDSYKPMSGYSIGGDEAVVSAEDLVNKSWEESKTAKAMRDAASPMSDHRKSLADATTVAVKSRDPEQMLEALGMMESDLYGNTKVFGDDVSDELRADADQLAREYHRRTKKYPPGPTGELLKQADDEDDAAATRREEERKTARPTKTLDETAGPMVPIDENGNVIPPKSPEPEYVPSLPGPLEDPYGPVKHAWDTY